MPTFLISIFLKYILPVLGIVAILFGAYEYGHSKGYSSGYQVAWDTQQKTINGMITANNAQAEANNKKIAEIEQDSFNATFQAKAAQQELENKRNTVVQQYAQQNPQTSQACGFDIPMVKAINAIIQADPTNNPQTSGDTK